MAGLADLYLWFKYIHVLAVFAWMAALFYLPRLFVYHATAAVGGELSEQLKVMERRLAKAIMWPSGIVAVVSGLLTALALGYGQGLPVWLWVKLGFVVILVAVHVKLQQHLGEFQRDERTRGHRYFRILNEVPTVALMGVVSGLVFGR